MIETVESQPISEFESQEIVLSQVSKSTSDKGAVFGRFKVTNKNGQHVKFHTFPIVIDGLQRHVEDLYDTPAKRRYVNVSFQNSTKNGDVNYKWFNEIHKCFYKLLGFTTSSDGKMNATGFQANMGMSSSDCSKYAILFRGVLHEVEEKENPKTGQIREAFTTIKFKIGAPWVAFTAENRPKQTSGDKSKNEKKGDYDMNNILTTVYHDFEDSDKIEQISVKRFENFEREVTWGDIATLFVQISDVSVIKSTTGVKTLTVAVNMDLLQVHIHKKAPKRSPFGQIITRKGATQKAVKLLTKEEEEEANERANNYESRTKNTAASDDESEQRDKNYYKDREPTERKRDYYEDRDDRRREKDYYNDSKKDRYDNHKSKDHYDEDRNPEPERKRSRSKESHERASHSRRDDESKRRESSHNDKGRK